MGRKQSRAEEKKTERRKKNRAEERGKENREEERGKENRAEEKKTEQKITNRGYERRTEQNEREQKKEEQGVGVLKVKLSRRFPHVHHLKESNTEISTPVGPAAAAFKTLKTVFKITEISLESFSNAFALMPSFDIVAAAADRIE